VTQSKDPGKQQKNLGFCGTDRISKYFTALVFDVMVPRMLGATSEETVEKLDEAVSFERFTGDMFASKRHIYFRQDRFSQRLRAAEELLCDAYDRHSGT
jgi:hypothetical protein